MTQSPEWTGPLPIGRAVDNYTMNIVGMGVCSVTRPQSPCAQSVRIPTG